MHLTIDLASIRKGWYSHVCDIPTLVELAENKTAGIIYFPETDASKSICNQLSSSVYIGHSVPGFLFLIINSAMQITKNGLCGKLTGAKITDDDFPFTLRW